MRPKKKILLCDPDENRRSIMRFVLRVWGYKVRAVATAGGVERSARRFTIDLFIFQMPLPEKWLAGAVNEARWQQPFAKTVFVSDKLKTFPEGIAVDCVLLGADCNQMQIRESVMMLCVCKRGPRPGFRAYGKPPKSVQQDIEALERALADLRARRAS